MINYESFLDFDRIRKQEVSSLREYIVKVLFGKIDFDGNWKDDRDISQAIHMDYTELTEYRSGERPLNHGSLHYLNSLVARLQTLDLIPIRNLTEQEFRELKEFFDSEGIGPLERAVCPDFEGEDMRYDPSRSFARDPTYSGDSQQPDLLEGGLDDFLGSLSPSQLRDHQMTVTKFNIAVQISLKLEQPDYDVVVPPSSS